jgi:hypothetical protein
MTTLALVSIEEIQAKKVLIYCNNNKVADERTDKISIKTPNPKCRIFLKIYQ